MPPSFKKRAPNKFTFMFLPLSSSSRNPSAPFSETQFPKASGDNSSCDEDSNYSLSPELPVSQESPLGLLPVPSPPETLTRSSLPSPNQVGSPKNEGDTVQLTFCKSRMQDCKTWVQMNSSTTAETNFGGLDSYCYGLLSSILFFFSSHAFIVKS